MLKILKKNFGEYVIISLLISVVFISGMLFVQHHDTFMDGLFVFLTQNY